MCFQTDKNTHWEEENVEGNEDKSGKWKEAKSQEKEKRKRN